jgi:hypothetical protein
VELEQPTDLEVTVTAPQGKRIQEASLRFESPASSESWASVWRADDTPRRDLQGRISGLSAGVPFTLSVTLELESGEVRGPHQVELRPVAAPEGR